MTEPYDGSSTDRPEGAMVPKQIELLEDDVARDPATTSESEEERERLERARQITEDFMRAYERTAGRVKVSADRIPTDQEIEELRQAIHRLSVEAYRARILETSQHTESILRRIWRILSLDPSLYTEERERRRSE